MNDFFLSYDLSTTQWIILIISAILAGMAKTGLSGVGLMIVPLLASAFGGRTSVGLLLPILIFADMFAVSWYHRHAEWKYILRVLPWALLGILAGTYLGKYLSEQAFNRLLAILVISGVGILVWQDIRKAKFIVPEKQWFAIALGLLGGFSTMIGNAAGPVMILYLLSMRLPKNQFIGTGAWFFFIVNLTKVPFHIWSWKTINLSSFLLDCLMIPAIAGGAVAGIYLVRFFPEKVYRMFIIISTLLSAFLLIR